jgi:Spy/CpxP family protein refolding chaperone
MKNSTNKFLIIAVILLLLANIALVAFMVMGKDKKNPAPEKGGKAVFERLVKEIGMTDAQQKQYDSLREAHFSKIRPLFDSMRVKRQLFFNLSKDDTLNDSLINVYTSYIAEKQIMADKLTLLHFHQVRKILNPDQQPKFDVFIKKMMQRSRRDSTAKKKD